MTKMLPWPTTVHLKQVQNEADWGFDPALHLKFNIDAKLGRFLYIALVKYDRAPISR